MEIREEQAFLKMFGSINYVLNMPGLVYTTDLVDASEEKTNGYSDYKKGLICIDQKLWNRTVDEADRTTQRVYYAIVAGTAAHEAMHVYQHRNLNFQRLQDFAFEGNLPNNPKDWTPEQLTQYWNLGIEIEAFAFGMLVEQILLKGVQASPIPPQMDKGAYQNMFDSLKEKYEQRIKTAFCNLL